MIRLTRLCAILQKRYNMCATFQLTADDVEKTHRITNDIDANTAKGQRSSASRTIYSPSRKLRSSGQGTKCAAALGLSDGTQQTGGLQREGRKPCGKSDVSLVPENRCLIPATRFYEFGADKSKYKVAFETLPFFYMAGLWMRETTAEGDKLFYVTIVRSSPTGPSAGFITGWQPFSPAEMRSGGFTGARKRWSCSECITSRYRLICRLPYDE